jgi:hypothetical protein
VMVYLLILKQKMDDSFQFGLNLFNRKIRVWKTKTLKSR